MKLINQKIFHFIVLTSLFLSIFSFTITSYVHLTDCHDGRCQKVENDWHTPAIKINDQKTFHECPICNFLLNNFLNFASVFLGILLIFSASKLVKHRNNIPKIVLFQNLARAPPHF